MRSIWMLLAAALALAQNAAAVTDADRKDVYKEFRTLFDAHKYQEARPVAEKLVSLTEEQYGVDNAALVNPLGNLATTAYRMKDYPTAEKNYLRTVEILEATGGNADRQLLRPLHGLGVTYLALQQYEDASTQLKRAIDLSRNLDGLFNIEQLEYLQPLIVSYVALGRTADADKEEQYALRVAENAYGNSDPHLLAPLDQYARYLEDIGRYANARSLHGRALGIAEQHAGRGSVLTVIPLRGVARTYRLEFLNGDEEPPAENNTDNSYPGSGGGLRGEASNTQRLNPDGERALKLALLAIDRAKPVDHKLRGETLIELGDWYLSGGAITGAIQTYGEAWKELAQVNATAPLEAPRLIAYKGPSSSVKRSQLAPESAELHFVEVAFTVGKDGHPSNIRIVRTDSPDAVQKAVVSSVKKARYSPRFEEGVAVDAADVTLREQLLLRKQKETSRFERN